ncbi:TetR/AcrR family transcriptional regulator [Thauera linaloolentis]|uniref:TetR family transcriptional regulator n=1 Tax=Thauera linaloolentis (strain DSM 12138 / JCM 21573 / CCUG 41526 / CIP 105981 / IAM 15112 / NBRC 102519 / 47Lol) TaxID=1123367 RepID=N6YY06_THAL4|nr:TetR/AcrR family transcriptional regulator [Thauera linaloolentis]ENO87282.1 TetR family transcriptional regulator [Thauera linaloolentis 47Lol = DSM 12138]MCM8566732.1 TetR/AcrR family transcriptional regulator [Thauera linaloolentis]
MPAIVDHESRRAHVARIAADIIARTGLEALTMRQIAAEAGFSTAIVTHYFANKQELMLHTYRSAALNAQDRVAAALSEAPGDLLACIEALLPCDEPSRQDWKVYLAFWRLAALDPDFAAEQASQAIKARAILRRVLLARAESGLPLPRQDVDQLAQHLLVLLIGTAVLAVFDPATWSREALRDYFIRELGAMGG